MAFSRALVLAAVAVTVLALLPSLVVEVDAKFSFAGFTSDLLSAGKTRRSRQLHVRPVYKARVAEHGPGQAAHPVPSPPAGGHHPPGFGHHPPGEGHHPPGVGHHPPNAFGVVPGHHPPGVGHHPPGVGGHPKKGHHCNKVPGLCLTPFFASLNETTCCSKTCVNLEADTEHCGSCPNICAVTDFCCSGVCKDVQTDHQNCGRCNIVCPTGVGCFGGMCRSYGYAPAPAPAPAT